MNKTNRFQLFSVFLGLAILSSCGKNTSTTSSNEDASTSGAVASAVGGASNGSSGGTLALNLDPKKSDGAFCSMIDALLPLHSAQASVACPTLASGGANCSVSGSTATLTYSGCSFGSSAATWNGSQIVTFAGANPACGSPHPTSMSSVTRTFSPGTTRTSASGVLVNLDTAGSYTAADSNVYSGGSTVSFSGGAKTGVNISGINVWAAGFHHTITTSAGAGGAPLVIANGNTITSGIAVTFHNLAKVKASSYFTNVGFTDGCCTPTSGTITTAFSAVGGVTPTAFGSKLIGTSETLTFSGCGTATFSGLDGTAGAVKLAHCF